MIFFHNDRHQTIMIKKERCTNSTQTKAFSYMMTSRKLKRSGTNNDFCTFLALKKNINGKTCRSVCGTKRKNYPSSIRIWTPFVSIVLETVGGTLSVKPINKKCKTSTTFQTKIHMYLVSKIR